MSAEAGRAERRFAAVVSAIHDRLPGPLALIPRTFIGFALINSFTFGVDMGLLWLFRGHLGIPYPIAVSLGFALAAMLAFVLNKWLNFRAHGKTASQSSKYAVVIASNYLLWILLFSSFLEWVGVHYQVSRITAALIEGAYIYLLSRFWVFRGAPVRQLAVAGTRAGTTGAGASRSELRPAGARGHSRD